MLGKFGVFAIAVIAIPVLALAVDSTRNRDNFFQSRKMEAALKSGVEAVSRKYGSSFDGNQILIRNPKCCEVFPFIQGAAPNGVDSRPLTSVMADRFLSLFGFDDYLVRLSVPVEGKIIEASLTVNGKGVVTDYL